MDKDIKNDGSKRRFKNIFKREKFVRFLDRQGFYVVLFICICVIGVTALVTTRDKDSLEEDRVESDIVEHGDQDMPLDSDIYMHGLYPELYPSGMSSGEDAGEDKKAASTDDSVDIKVEDVLTDEEKDEATDDGSKEETKKQDESKDAKSDGESAKDSNGAKKDTGHETKSVANPQEEKPISSKMAKVTMLKPVQGDAIICDYAQDELIYSSTLKEWRTHPGIDIECPLGSEVRAVTDGLVQSIEEDPLMGITITIDHGEGLLTKYANLSTKDMVQVGQKVAGGQVISGVGRTAAAEILDPPHLHFEVMVDGKHVDPNKFFE